MVGDNIYIISNSKKNKFMVRDSSGRFTWTTNKDAADRWSYDKAKAVVKNNLGSGNYKVVSYINLEEVNSKKVDFKKLDIDRGMKEEGLSSDTKSSDEPYDNAGMISFIEKTADEEYKKHRDVSIDVESVLKVFSMLESDLDDYEKSVKNDLIRVSRAITDINHYREIYPKRPANQRCKLDVFETQCIIKRRDLKNTLYYIDCIKKKLKGEGFTIISEPSYVPRELNDLIKNGNIPDFDEWWGK